MQNLLRVLQAHILHLDGDEMAVLNGLVQSLAGVVGMHMDLDDLVVVHQHQTVAQAVQEGPELFGVILILPANDELGAIGKGDVLGIEVGEIGGFLDCAILSPILRDDHILTLQGQQHCFQCQSPALAAGIHNSRLFQHGVLVHSIGQGDLRLFQGGHLDKLHIVLLLGSGSGLGGSQPGDGEDGALGGLHNGLIGSVHALLQGLGPQNTIAAVMALQCPLQALEEQRQDHARVAPGAPQCGGSGGLGHGVQLGAVHTPQIVGCGVDSHGHIRAGVAIGHGENVQFIQILLVDLDRGGCAEDHSLQFSPRNGLQLLTPPKFIQSSWNRYRHSPHGPSSRYTW